MVSHSNDSNGAYEFINPFQPSAAFHIDSLRLFIHPITPFIPNALFSIRGFSGFQVVEKGCIGNE